MRLRTKEKFTQTPIRVGVPKISELVEGVPVIRFVRSGLIQYIKYNNVVYYSKFDRLSSLHKEDKFFVKSKKGGSFTFKEGFKIVWGEILSNSDSIKSFPFFEKFKSECFGVFLNSQIEDQNQENFAVNITKSGFKINRRNGNIDATINYLAIGK